MSFLFRNYHRLNAMQRTMRFRVVASIIVVVLCGIVFGPLQVRSHGLHTQRLALGRALTGQNLVDGDQHAVAFAETGTVVVGGRTYGGPHLQRRARMYFDEEGLLITPRLVEHLLEDQLPAGVPAFLVQQPGTTWMLYAIATAWLLLIVWMRITVQFILTLLATAVPVLISLGFGSDRAMLAFAGMGMLTFTFVLLTQVVLLVFQLPHQALAVAHTVVKEATRNRLSLVFVVLLVVGLPLLPLELNADSPLRFRIQTFIARSLGYTYVMAACMTLFLSCATVAFEIRDRQIWQLMTKPLRRANYLLGKWIGVLSVNLVLLIVAGVSIFTYVQYLSGLPVAPGIEGMLDRLAVTDEVLTARVGGRPTLNTLTREQIYARVDDEIRRDSETGDPQDVPLSVKRTMAREMQEAFVTLQRSVPPIEELQPGGNQRTYVFEDLGRAKNLQSTLTLRYRFHILHDDEHETYPVGFVFNDRPDTAVQRQYIPTVTHVLPVGTDLIRDDGTMAVTVVNLHRPLPDQKGYGELNFEHGDFELLYKVDSFEANFVRAVILTWVKLAFLSMLGLAAATMLNFPVACLLSFTVFLAATIGPFLATSLDEYYPPVWSQIDKTDIGMVILWAFQSTIRVIAQGLVYVLHSFGEYTPTQSLVEGRLIGWRAVANGVFWIGFVWSGIAMLIGYLSIRNRQLAIYSGHG